MQLIIHRSDDTPKTLATFGSIEQAQEYLDTFEPLLCPTLRRIATGLWRTDTHWLARPKLAGPSVYWEVVE